MVEAGNCQVGVLEDGICALAGDMVEVGNWKIGLLEDPKVLFEIMLCGFEFEFDTPNIDYDNAVGIVVLKNANQKQSFNYWLMRMYLINLHHIDSY